ncbi:MAG: ADP-ribose pyrophosphatase [Firmicutes bacterium ADurb.Bin419]|nr:MAG: ADP-ribose pyrophosphatase [Firmicutes bacterium ADurb.Bin419]
MPSPGCMAEKVWLLCGIVDVNKAASFGGLEDEGEDIKVHIISFDDGVKMLKNNEIHNANTVVGMQWLILNREYLRNKYQ